MLIAFDNAKVSPRPSRWDMKRVLVVSSMLALIGVVQSAGLLRVLHHETHLDVPAIRAGMFIVIAGHLLLFWTRSSGSFWQRPFPEWKFFGAIMGAHNGASDGSEGLAGSSHLLEPHRYHLVL